MTTFILRTTKILMMATCAIWMGLIAASNLSYQEYNLSLAQDILGMSSIPEDVSHDRAITDKNDQMFAFDMIVFFQVLASACCGLGAIMLLIFAFRDQSDFHRAKWLSCLGLAIVTGLYFFGFYAIASEYFYTYLSEDAAIQQIGRIGLTNAIFALVIVSFLIQPESMPITKKKQLTSTQPTKPRGNK